MAAKSIEFKPLSEVETQEARKQSIAPKSNALEEGITMVVGKATIENVSIDGGTPHACPIVNFYYPNDWDTKNKKEKKDAKPYCVFLKAQCRIIRDFAQNMVELKGSFTAQIRQLADTHNAGEIIDFINTKIGSLVKSTRVDFYSISRKGETYPTARNGFDWIE
jgi:hypothetical protein